TARRRLAGEGMLPARPAVPVPWFLLGFLGMMLFNSLDLLPSAAKTELAQVTTLLLAVALAAMGLETDLQQAFARGWRRLLLGGAAWLFIAAFSLGLIELAAI